MIHSPTENTKERTSGLHSLSLTALPTSPTLKSSRLGESSDPHPPAYRYAEVANHCDGTRKHRGLPIESKAPLGLLFYDLAVKQRVSSGFVLRLSFFGGLYEYVFEIASCSNSKGVDSLWTVCAVQGRKGYRRARTKNTIKKQTTV